MSLFRTVKFLNLQTSSHLHKLLPPSPLLQRTLCISPHPEHPINDDSEGIKEEKKKNQKPLDVLFKEAVGLSERSGDSEGESEDSELMRRLRKLESQVRKLKANSDYEVVVRKEEGQSRSLYAVFTNQVEKKPVEMVREKPMVFKELSPDMERLVSHLYKEGYFKDGNFLPKGRLDLSCFENSFGQDYIKCAVVKFGKDHQEIAKWLSGSDLKMVALFGCPSLAKKDVFAAKSLRRFLGIQEDTVCRKCVLKKSCKFVNQRVWKAAAQNLNLASVMRVITLYALESVPPQLVVPSEIKASVSRLLKEVVDLSTTIS